MIENGHQLTSTANRNRSKLEFTIQTIDFFGDNLQVQIHYIQIVIFNQYPLFLY